jgi:histidine triad (HIT) family protein
MVLAHGGSGEEVPMSDCPFCKRIAAGDYLQPFAPDPDVVWFRPLNPVTRGHMLFVPVRHVEDALADPYATALTMEIASTWAAKHRSRADGWNFITSVGEAATQTVKHLHLHLIPRRLGDGLALPWTGQQREELSRMVEDLRAFEREYRARLIAHLEGQLADLKGETGG